MDRCVRFAELAEFGESGGGLAGVDGFRALGDTFFEVLSEAGGYQGGGGIQENNVAAGAGNAGKDVVEQGRIQLHVAPAELVESGARQASHFGSDAGGFERRRPGFGLFNPGDN